MIEVKPQSFLNNFFMVFINELIKTGYLKTPEIINAFRKIKRADFLLDEYKNVANLDIPLPIGYGQTISQPLTVAFMLEALSPRKGDKISKNKFEQQRFSGFVFVPLVKE